MTDPAKLERVKEAWRKELEHYRSLDQKERAKYLAECVKFCRRKFLFSKKERERLWTDQVYLKEMAMEAMWRKTLYLEEHPEEG